MVDEIRDGHTGSGQVRDDDGACLEFEPVNLWANRDLDCDRDIGGIEYPTGTVKFGTIGSGTLSGGVATLTKT
jgi:hypothetical protein